MMTRYDNTVLDVVCRAMIPLLVLFALYVALHGHYSPGGGFQAGAILAASGMLLRLALGVDRTGAWLPPRLAPVLGVLGLAVYMGTGLAAVIVGGNFLDYAFLPIPAVTEPYLRHLGILCVEVGIALSVFGILLTIFDRLAGQR